MQCTIQIFEAYRIISVAVPFHGKTKYSIPMGNKPDQQKVSQRIPLNEWETDFKVRGEFYKNGPVMDRKCNDVCCLVTFLVFLTSFLALGGYFIASSSMMVRSTTPNQITTLAAFNSTSNGPFAGIFIGMICLSVVMSLCLIGLAASCSKCLVWGLIAFSITLLAAIAAIGFVIGNIAMGVSITVLTIIYCFVLYCYLRDHLNTAVLLVKCAGEFISDRPQTYLIGLVVGLLTIGFSVYWVFGYLGILTLTTAGTFPFTAMASTIFQVFFWLLYVFFTYFFYFATVFLVGASVGMWYYKKEGGSVLCTAMGWLFRSHLGSITFGALMTTLIRGLRMIAVENSYNPAQRVCFNLLTCMFRSLEYFLKTLNHYAAINMSFTGESYVASARTAGLMLFSNIGLFGAVDIITTFLFYVSIIVCVGIPTGLSALFAYYTIPFVGISLVVWMVVPVFMFSLLVSSTFLTIFADSLSSVFYFYCLDKKLTETGFTLSNCPDSIRSLMCQMEGDNASYLPNCSSEGFKVKANQVHVEATSP